MSSDANLTRLLYYKEAAFAETPSTANKLALLRFVSDSLVHEKDTVVSAEVQANRARSELIQVGLGVTGSIETEFLVTAYNSLIVSALMGSALSAATLSSLTGTISASADTLTLSVGSFTAAAQGAKFVKVAGSLTAANNGIKRVVSCTSSVLTVDPTFNGGFTVNDTANASITVSYAYVRNGSTLDSYLFEKQFAGLDTAHYMGFTGCCVDTWSLRMAAQDRLLQTFGVIGAQGLQGAATYGDGSPTAASTNKICNTSTNIGAMVWGTSAMTAEVLSLDFDLKNNLRTRDKLGSAITSKLGRGALDITGTIEAYFSDSTMLADFMNHTARALLLPIVDPDGNLMSIHLPVTKASAGSPVVQGVNTDLMIPYEFVATDSATLGYAIQVDTLTA